MDEGEKLQLQKFELIDSKILSKGYDPLAF